MKFPYLLLRLRLFCITLIFAFFLFDEVRGQCLAHHKSLLLKFKHSLVINESHIHDKSSKLANWITSTDCCLWPGVTCSGAYVTGLDLSDEGIVGGFNDSSPLFDLTGLTSLNLAMMHQKTVIPSEIGRLINLMALNMSRSDFIGQIPIEVSNLTRLVSLDASYCADLKAENPNLRMLVGNLSNLIDLRLDKVNLSSQSREWCQALSSSTPRLQVLNLHYCGLLGPIHDSLMKLAHLSIVDLSDNDFSGPIPYEVFASLEKLTSLTLKSCEFNGVFPHTMLHFPHLKFLDMSWNDNLEAGPSITFRNSSLETLLLSELRIFKTIPESIGEAKMLSHLDLSFCNLSGQIPKSISQLEHLVHLDMSNNNLDGQIPSFSRTRNLTVLDLSYNRLHGSILATDWKKLDQIESLILRSNNLSGSIPTSLFETPSLKILNLEGNHFTGFTNESDVMSSSSHLLQLNLRGNGLQGSFIPPFIYGLTSLLLLDLSFNNFRDTFHLDLLQSMRNLTHLYLSQSKLEMKIGNNFPALPQLFTLELASCNLKEFPPFLTNQSTLWKLDLSENQIDGIIPNHIWNMSTLSRLNLSHNRLEFLGREELPRRFVILDLSSNQLQGKVPNIPQQIRLFSLSSNKLHGSIPQSLCNATYIEVLDFSNNSLSGTLPQCWTQMPYLAVLNLRKNNMSGIIPDTLLSSCVLQTLDLSYNSFQGRIPKSLGGCNSLEALNMGYNKLHDMFPCWMTNVTKLTVLVLRSNSLYGTTQCLNHKYNWSRLQIMDIASNNFGGELPSRGLLSWKAMLVEEDSTYYSGDLHYQKDILTTFHITGKLNLVTMYFQNTVSVMVKGLQLNLTKISAMFTLVDFSDNSFGGGIPHELGELKFLYALNLSNNYLSGRIPPSFGNLYRIESLDLSKNELSGKIPGQLAALTFLSLLNLSFNHLEGMVPQGSQFQTFTEASFMGNEGLCGQPLKKSCGDGGESSPPNQSSEAEDKFRDIFIATEIGYALGLGLVIMPLIFWSRWRNGYYEWIDKVLMSIFCCCPLASKIRLRR
ncbi:unnamed protein product [Rhodiola kirilowii]